MRSKYSGISAREKKRVVRRLYTRELLRALVKSGSIGFRQEIWFGPGLSLFLFGQPLWWARFRRSPPSPIRALLLRNRFRRHIQQTASLRPLFPRTVRQESPVRLAILNIGAKTSSQ